MSNFQGPNPAKRRRMYSGPSSSASTNSAGFSTSWYDPNQTDYTELRRWEYVNCTDTDEGRRVGMQLQESMPGMEYTNITRIHHPLLLRKFLARQDALAVKLGGDSNTLRLWHGTQGTNPSEILRSELGLTSLMSAGGFYGKGIYFAEHARYSNDYFNVNAQSGEREILLVLVAVGRSKEFQQQLCKQLNPAKDLVDRSRSTRSTEVLFDSVCGGPHCPSHRGSGDNDSKMYVVYQDSSIYPAYKVRYRPKQQVTGSFKAQTSVQNAIPPIGRRVGRPHLPVPNTITIRIKDEGGDETFFKVRPTTKMSKIFKAFADRKMVALTSLIFSMNRDSIDGLSTPLSLQLQDQDRIDCHPKTITIRIKDEGGDETFILVTQTTKMSKIFNAYADRKMVALTSLIFSMNRDSIDGLSTPLSLQLQDQDRIDCHPKTITIRIKDEGGDETFFKVRPTTKMSKIFNAYADRKMVALTSLIFSMNRDTIDGLSTPLSLQLQDQDRIDCHLITTL